MKNAFKEAVLAGMVVIVFSAPCIAETISPRRLVEVADLAGPVISVDGRSVAFRWEQASVERNTYDSVWYVQSLDGVSPPRRVADGGVPLRASWGLPLAVSAVWSPDGRWIYYRAQIDGKVDVWRAAADGSGAEAVTLDPADVRGFSLSADGRTLSYSVGASREEVIAAELAEYDHGIRVDTKVPVGQSLFRSGNTEGRLATERFGDLWADRVPLLADVPDRWKAIDLVAGEKRDLAPSDRPIRPLTVSDLAENLSEPWALASEPGDGRIAMLTRIGHADGLQYKPYIQLAMLPNRSASQPVVCQDELCTRKAISRIEWRPNSDEVLFTVTDPNEGLAQSIFRWDVRTNLVRPVIRSTGLLSGGRDRSSPCGLSSALLVCVTAEADRPPRLESIDLESGHRQVLFDPNAALAQDIAEAVPSRLLRWTDANGQEFSGQFFAARNTAGTPSPLFITFYSCEGFLRGGVGDEWPLTSLAEHGISSLCINQAEQRFEDRVMRYDQAMSAIENSINVLASNGEIDREKVGMGGLSYGSAVTLWTAMKSDLLAAASVASPVVSPTYYLLNSLKGSVFTDNLSRLWGLGAPEETPERWRILSPAFNLEEIQTPILMQIPEQEYVMALDYAIPLMRDNRADLYVFPHEPHQKFQPRHKLAAYQRNLDWFRFWLQDYEDPDPAKREQYTHWRAMRERHAGK